MSDDPTPPRPPILKRLDLWITIVAVLFVVLLIVAMLLPKPT